jgi:hypothetical protein
VKFILKIWLFRVALFWCNLWKSYASCTDTIQEAGVCPATTLVITVPPRMSRATLFGATPEWVVPVILASLMCIIGHWLSFFIFLSSPYGGSIVDFGVPSPLGSLWYLKSILWVGTLIMLGTYVHLYRLILFHFKIFAWMNSFVRDWRLNQCIFISIRWQCCMNDKFAFHLGMRLRIGTLYNHWFTTWLGFRISLLIYCSCRNLSCNFFVKHGK